MISNPIDGKRKHGPSHLNQFHATFRSDQHDLSQVVRLPWCTEIISRMGLNTLKEWMPAWFYIEMEKINCRLLKCRMYVYEIYDKWEYIYVCVCAYVNIYMCVCVFI